MSRPQSSNGPSCQNDTGFLYQNNFVFHEDVHGIPRRPRPQFINQPFYPYFPIPQPQQQRVPGPSVPSDELSSCASASMEENSSSTVTVSSQSTTANNTCNDNGAKATTKWRERETSVLVSEWSDRIEEVESARATETWHKIADAVNKVATNPKTIKQCKDKIRNLKKAYKEAKTNNNKTGRPPQTSPYYDSFDEVLGTRAVVTMPGVIQSGQAQSESSSNGSQDSRTYNSDASDEESDLDSSVGSDSETSARTRRAKRKEEKQPLKKAKKARVTTASAMIDLTEKLLEMQNAQAKMMDNAQKRTEELLIKLEADQRKLDEQSRARDQEFFLRMAEILKK